MEMRLVQIVKSLAQNQLRCILRRFDTSYFR